MRVVFIPPKRHKLAGGHLLSQFDEYREFLKREFHYNFFELTLNFKSNWAFYRSIFVNLKNVNIDRVYSRSAVTTVIAIVAKRFYRQSFLVLNDVRGIPWKERQLEKGRFDLGCVVLKFSGYMAWKYSDRNNVVTSSLGRFMSSFTGVACDYSIIPSLYFGNTAKTTGFERNIIYTGGLSQWQLTDKIVDIMCCLVDDFKWQAWFFTNDSDYSTPKQIKMVNIERSGLIKKINQLGGVGIILRDDNIINKVSAPIKIAEYLSLGLGLICSSNIGVMKDISSTNTLHVNYKDSSYDIASNIDAYFISSRTNICEENRHILSALKYKGKIYEFFN